MLLSARRALRILDFDIETRLVGFHYGGRFKPQGSEPTAIAAKFLDDADAFGPYVWLQPEDTVEDMLRGFTVLYNAADIVTGHYIKKFDLPILNGAMFEHGLPLLDPLKLVQDTKVDLKSFEGLSKSQENLATMLDTFEQKYKMNDARWRRSTRLEADGVAETRIRVTDDVRQHIALRAALIEAGALNPPTEWRP